MSDIPEPPHLGPTLREKRADLTWTLDRLATESGVSRSMLSEIERGDANPTFATLWGITQALGLEIHELMSEAEDRQRVATIDVTRPTFVPTMSSDDGRVTLRALGPVQTADAVEWYILDFEPNGSLRSTAHVAGTEEHLTVLDGTLTVRSGESSETITTGATARYRGDLNHEISNPTNATSASAILVVLGAQR